MTEYNYVFFDIADDNMLRRNPDGYYAICTEDLQKLENVLLVSYPLDYASPLIRFLFGLHHTNHINKYVNLPLKSLWFPYYFKPHFAVERPLCFVVSGTYLSVDYLRYLKKKYPDAKFVKIHRDLVELWKKRYPWYTDEVVKEIYDLSPAEMRALRPKMQIIFQDPFSSLSPRLPVGEIIGEAVREHNLVSKAEFDDYIDQVMDNCGLQPYHKTRYPHEFSGGQRQRICIARALALNPEFVVCDEPVSALDVSIQAQIINLLKELQEKYNLTYLFISHDLSVVEHISDHVGVMYLGNLVEYGETQDIFDRPLHPYTKALFSAIPIPDPTVRRERIVLQGSIPFAAYLFKTI